MITPKEQIIVHEYLKTINVWYQEFFDELYDHIVISFEERADKNQNISDHLRDNIQPSFGGVKGIQTVMRRQSRLRRRMVSKRAWTLFKSYLFGWPSVLVTLAILSFAYILHTTFGAETAFLTLGSIGTLVPALVAFVGVQKFHKECKRQNLPYRHRDSNQAIMIFSCLGLWSFSLVLNLVNVLVIRSDVSGLDLLGQYPWIQISLAIIYSLYAVVAHRLFKESFQIKLQLI